MTGKKWLVKDSAVEDGVKFWFLYEFAGDPYDFGDNILDYSSWQLIHLDLLTLKKKYSSEEELELEVTLAYGDTAELLVLPRSRFW